MYKTGVTAIFWMSSLVKIFLWGPIQHIVAVILVQLFQSGCTQYFAFKLVCGKCDVGGPISAGPTLGQESVFDSGLSLLGPMNSIPSTGMSLSLIAFWTQERYRRKSSVHGSPLPSPFRNFSANHRLKHWSYSRFMSVHSSPTLFMSLPVTLPDNAHHTQQCLLCPL